MRAFLLLCLLPGLASAGPWPRQAGELYALVSHQGGGDGWSGLYLEYGALRQLTFGLDLGGHVVGLAELRRTGFTDRQVDGRVRSFLRVPVPLPGRGDGWLAPWLAAVELSIGRDYEEDGRELTRFGLGATVGRGFTTRFGDGWTNLDLGVSTAPEGAERTALGWVVGVKPRPRLAVELSLFAERETSAEAEATIDYQIGPTVQYGFGTLGEGRLGVAYKSDGGTAVTLGWARTF